MFFSVPPRRTVLAVAQFLLVVLLLLWLFALGEEQLGYRWHWNRIPRFLLSWENGSFVPGPLLTGLFMTLKISLASLGLALFFGLLASLMQRSQNFSLRFLALSYVEFIRNTPLLIQVFFLYFVLAPLFGMSAFVCAVIALSLFEGAYACEIFRAGIDSIAKGQWEAAQSLGMTRFHVYRFVILPQALRIILPPLTGIMISLVKDSSLASTIAIYELTQQGNIIVSDTFLTFEIWFTVALIYLCITLTLSLLAALLERKLALHT